MLSVFESLCNESGASIDVRLERVSLIALVLFLSLLLANGSVLTMPIELVAIKARTLGGTPINFPYVCFSRLLLDGSPCPLYAITCDSCNRTLDGLVLHGLAPCSYNGFRKEIMASFSMWISKSWKTTTCRRCLELEPEEAKVEKIAQILDARGIVDPGGLAHTVIADWEEGIDSITDILVMTMVKYLPTRPSLYWPLPGAIYPIISQGSAVEPFRALGRSIPIDSFVSEDHQLVIADLKDWVADHYARSIGLTTLELMQLVRNHHFRPPAPSRRPIDAMIHDDEIDILFLRLPYNANVTREQLMAMPGWERAGAEEALAPARAAAASGSSNRFGDLATLD